MSRLPQLVVVLLALVAVTSIAEAADEEHLMFQTIRRGDSRLLASLLRQGAPTNLRRSDGVTPLMVAALRGPAESVRLLLEHGADPNAASKDKVTALIWAAGDLDKVRLLLKHGAKVDARSRRGNTPLLVASAHGDSTATVALLLEHGANPTEKNDRGATALQNAVTAANLETVRLLVEKGAKAKGVGIAADRGSLELTKFLLEQGADPNTGPGRHPLLAALLAQKPAIARLLIENKVKLDRTLNPGGVTPFLLAAYSETGDASILKSMLDSDINIEAANQYGETALTWARKRGHKDIIDLLVKAGVPEGKLKTKELPARDVKLTDENRSDVLRQSVSKSIALLQHSSDVFLERRENCVSCHHQNLPAVAVGWARDRGVEVDRKSIERMIDGQLRSWRPRIERAYQVDRPVPVAARFIGYGLLGFSELGYPRDEVTDAMAWYLAAIQQPDGRWIAGMMRPPVGGADIVATVLAMRSLQLYPLEGCETAYARRVAKAREWLQNAKPRTHQERAYRLLGLGWAGLPTDALAEQVVVLLEEQRKDGGWAQLPGLPSDAWATGQTLVALHTAGGVPTTHAAYREGLEFLLQTQFEDGSWYVRTRTWPFQTHFDSEFPHGKDQWVSAPATAWASMAMTLAIEREGDVAAPARSPDTKSAATTAKPEPPAPARPAPPLKPGERPRFATHVQPILELSCAGCHSGDKPKGGYRVTSREQLLKGGDSGEAAVVANQVEQSPLLRFISDEVEDMEMPPLAQRKKYPALSKPQVEILKQWIRQGATWPKEAVLRNSK